MPARRARGGKLERPLPRELESALHNSGNDRLYTHQAAAINAVRQAQQVIGHRRVQQFREEVLGMEDLVPPQQTFDTVACGGRCRQLF